jgi:ATP-binding cassette subfamily F protein 3
MAEARYAQSQLEKAEKALARQTAEVARLDGQILELSSKAGHDTAKLQSLLAARAKAGDALDQAEQAWLAAGEALEAFEQA